MDISSHQRRVFFLWIEAINLSNCASVDICSSAEKHTLDADSIASFAANLIQVELMSETFRETFSSQMQYYYYYSFAIIVLPILLQHISCIFCYSTSAISNYNKNL